MDRYPYFLYQAVCELQRNPDQQYSMELKEFIGVNVDNRDARLLLTGDLDESIRNFYRKDSPPAETAVDIYIDSFISRFSNGAQPQVPEVLISSSSQAESREAEKKEIIERTPEVPEVSAPTKTPKSRKPESKATPSEQPEVTESLDVIMERVKFMVKNRNYDEALEIMEAFYLNNPKKSVYFADQIRFLRKLKLNESKK